MNGESASINTQNESPGGNANARFCLGYLRLDRLLWERRIRAFGRTSSDLPGNRSQSSRQISSSSRHSQPDITPRLGKVISSLLDVTSRCDKRPSHPHSTASHIPSPPLKTAALHDSANDFLDLGVWQRRDDWAIAYCTDRVRLNSNALGFRPAVH